MTETPRPDSAGEFWQTEPGWVLHDVGHGGYLPVNELRGTAMLVCDDAECDRITAGMLQSGCPVRLVPHADELPFFADIFVDGVPPDALRTLVELRRALRTLWPFAALRDLLATQPFHAGNHDLAELQTLLTAAPHLRPYVFYETRAGLRPAWLGAAGIAAARW